jgi:hypothetical protein
VLETPLPTPRPTQVGTHTMAGQNGARSNPFTHTQTERDTHIGWPAHTHVEVDALTRRPGAQDDIRTLGYEYFMMENTDFFKDKVQPSPSPVPSLSVSVLVALARMCAAVQAPRTGAPCAGRVCVYVCLGVAPDVCWSN